MAYGHASELQETMDALGQRKREGDCVVLVDNHPAAESARFAEAHTAVDITLRSINKGFAGGCNLGVKHLPPSIELIFLLNPDAVLADGALSKLRHAPNEWAAWMGLLIMPDGKVNSVGIVNSSDWSLLV